MSPFIQKALIHFAKLAALGAGATIVAGLLVLISGVNIATLPITYQIFAAMLVPLIVGALKQAQTEIAAELATEQAAVEAKRANLAEAKLATINVPSATPSSGHKLI